MSSVHTTESNKKASKQTKKNNKKKREKKAPDKASKCDLAFLFLFPVSIKESWLHSSRSPASIFLFSAMGIRETPAFLMNVVGSFAAKEALGELGGLVGGSSGIWAKEPKLNLYPFSLEKINQQQGMPTCTRGCPVTSTCPRSRI